MPCSRIAANVLGHTCLQEAAAKLNDVSVLSELRLDSSVALIEQIGSSRERKLRELVRQFQDTPSETSADSHWKEIEKLIFGIDYSASGRR